MSLLSVSGLSFAYSFGAPLFQNVSFSVDPGARLAVVGANGAGKSTLLKLLMGELSPSDGAIARRSGLIVAAVEQDTSRFDKQSLFDFAFGVLRHHSWLRARLHELESAPLDQDTANEYAERINEYQETGGYAAESKLAQNLHGLGFAVTDFHREMAALSGGERTRAALARALLAEADVLILDEPSNHLDIEARQWLEEHLLSRAGACVLTSHDRALLSAFSKEVLEIDRAQVRLFSGSYDNYRSARALLDQQAWSEYEAFERRKAAAESAACRRDTLAARVARAPEGARHSKDHFGRKASKVARTGRILRERVRDAVAVQKPWVVEPLDGLSFDRMTRSGDVVLNAEGLEKRRGGKLLFRDLSITLRRGDRLTVAGRNGSGKTTLLQILSGTAEPDAGEVQLGANVEIGSMRQDLDSWELDRSPLEVCGSDTASRTLLACLRLRSDCLNRPLRELSGGERTKVALARLLNSPANLLFLDEPTNHLEIDALEALERALACYPGTLVVVSHDRCFVEALGPDLQVLDLSAVGSIPAA